MSCSVSVVKLVLVVKAASLRYRILRCPLMRLKKCILRIRRRRRRGRRENRKYCTRACDDDPVFPSRSTVDIPWVIPNSSKGFSLLDLEKMHPQGPEDNCFGWWIGAELQQEPPSTPKILNADTNPEEENLASSIPATDEIDGTELPSSSTQGSLKVLKGTSLQIRERRDSGFDDDGSNGFSAPDTIRRDSLQPSPSAPTTTKGLCYTPERLVKSNDFRILVPSSPPKSTPSNTPNEAKFSPCSCCCCCCRSRSLHLHRPLIQRDVGREVDGTVLAERPLGSFGSRNDDRAGAADLEALLRNGAFLHDTELARSTRPSSSLHPPNSGETILKEDPRYCCCYRLHQSFDTDVSGQNKYSKAQIERNQQLSRRSSTNECGCCSVCASKPIYKDDEGDTIQAHSRHNESARRDNENSRWRSSKDQPYSEKSTPKADRTRLRDLFENGCQVNSATIRKRPTLQEIKRTNALKFEDDDVFDEEQNFFGSASWELESAGAATTMWIGSSIRASLVPLKDRLRGLHDSNGSIVDDLAELRADFSREELRIEHLLDDTRKLRNEVNELRYLDDLLNLLNGKLEKISRRSWPFTVRHKSLKNEDVNLIV